MKYSVIIPVYNAGETLNRCIKSITDQGREDVELIIVNDGSTDESDGLCRDFLSRHNNIIYLNKENGGVSSARNAGLSVATGKYVMFVDSDDYVDGKCFEVLDGYTESDADYYQLVYSVVQNGEVTGDKAWPDRKVYTADEKESFISESVVTRAINSCWAKLYKREVIEENGLRFYEKLSVGEDLTFVFAFLLSANSFERAYSRIYYVDVSNEESLSRRYRENLSEQLLCVYDRMLKALEESGTESESVRAALSWLHYRNAYSVVNDLSRSKLSLGERRKKLSEMCRLFNGRNVRPAGLKCKIIAIPVRLRLMGIVDAGFRIINKLR